MRTAPGTATGEALSLQQLRLWLECQTTQGNNAYRMPSAVLLGGSIDTARLAAAFTQVIRRHPLLQCSFRQHRGCVQQIANQPVQADIQRIDIAADNRAALHDYIAKWFGHALDIENGPLLRMQITELASTAGLSHYLLLLDIHHLLSDGWSNRLLLEEMLAIYENAEASLPQSTDYFSYIHWQQQQLQQGVLTEQLQFWQHELKGLEALALPVMPSESFDLTITPRLAIADVSVQARTWQITPFAIYMAAWQLTLHKLCQQTRFAVITPFANRQREEFFRTVGLFANALPVTADFSQPQTLQALAYACHQRLQLANANSEVPFAGIAEQWQQAGQGDLALLFNAAISYDNAPLQQQLAMPGYSIELLPVPGTTGKFPLALSISHNSTTTACIEYHPQQFTHDFMCRLAGYYQRSVQAIIEQPGLSVRAFSLLDHRQQLAMLGLAPGQDPLLQTIGKSNCNHHVLPPQTQLHKLIEQQCRATPDALAASCDNYRFSYAELDRKASQMASHIAGRFGSGGIIAISLPRSALVSVAVLGILKSGNAYLPLDAQFPPARLQQIIGEAQPAAIIISLAADTAQGHGFGNNLPCINIEDPAWQSSTATAPTSDNRLFNLIYTSGSTGKPKGVRVLHEGIINRLLWMQAQFPLQPDDVVLQKTPLTFDVSVWELFWPLLAGASLFYARPDGHRDADYLRETLREKRISTVHFVPSMLDLFTEKPAQLPALRQIFCSGEALHIRQANRCLELYPQTALFNLYGPTEASVDVSFFDCRQPHCATSIPIGKPIWNTQLHLLDDTLRPVPPGCIGELYIGGCGLAEGYHSNDALTADSFIDNPWYLDDHPSARLYKTCDLGRYLPDGNIEFIGRTDLQFKLRGLRIEAGDIEQQALQLAGVKRAAVIAENNLLTLYYQAGETISHNHWRQFLAGLLPDWMIPNRFIAVAEWPLSSSGKTSRKALASLPETPARYIKAEPGMAREVQAIWEQCLGHAVSADADFFASGGHSLLAMRLLAELAAAFNVNLQLADIFNHASINSMANRISQLPQHTGSIRPAPLATRYPASFQQQRLFLFQKLFPQATAYHMPSAFDIHGEVNETALAQALAKLLQRHAILHTLYAAGEEQVWQLPVPGHPWQMAYSDLSDTGADMVRLASLHGQQLFDLEKDLPLRATLYKLGDHHYLFCLCLHHIAGDALTLAILARELAALYNAEISPQALSLPDLPLQYHDYACWQQQQNWQEPLQWWQQALAGVPELLTLPHDRPRPALQSFNGAQLLAELDQDLVSRLQEFCRTQHLTAFMVLLSCLHIFLGKLASQNDVCIGVPVAGRNHQGLTGLAGFFVNSLLLRGRLHHNPVFADFLQQQKNHIADAFAHQDIAVETVLASLGFTRNTRFTPVAQVGFNFLQDNGSEALLLDLQGLQIHPLQTPVNTAKYEMTWIFYQHLEGIRLCIEFNTALFDETTIRDWADKFQTLLGNAISAPATPIQQLRCLHEDDIRQLLQQDFAALENCYPLTATQRDIYLDSLLFPHKRHNQLGFLTHSTTVLDIGLWRTVLEDLYNHADSLRARIVRTRHALLDIAWQAIPATGTLPGSCLDFHYHGDIRLDEQAKQKAIATALFSPWEETDPLWRVHIHQFEGGDYLFILAAHHAMFDGVSIQMLGRMMKGNYQKLVEGCAADYPANNYADFVHQHNLRCDSAAAYRFWQKQAESLQAYLDFRPLLADRPDAFASIEQRLDLADWQKLESLCKSWRSSAALFFKAVFALAIKAWHHMEGSFCFTEVVLGRDKAFYTTQGLFFEQQPVIINNDATNPANSIAQLLATLRQYRKQIMPYLPLSLRLQQQLLPSALPYLFNFYIMESATAFFGKEEHIEHLMPEMDHAVNCIIKIIDQQAHIQLMFNRQELQGEDFLALMMHIIRQCLAGHTLIAELLPVLAETSAGRWPRPMQTAVKNTIAMPVRTPQNAIEQQLLEIWQEVLGRDDIGIDDNFFELGGHSLHAMRIASRLREQYSVELPLDAIFGKPTIAGIAHMLQQAEHTTARPLPALKKSAVPPVYPLTSGQKRLWFMTRIDQASLAYNMPSALHLNGKLDLQALEQALATLLERQTLLRSVIDDKQAMPQWQLLSSDCIGIELINCTPWQAADKNWLQQQINAEAIRPFTISGEPLLRVKLLSLSAYSQVLMLTLHHLVGDAQSLLIIARELTTLYNAFRHGQPNPLAELPLQFSDYALWQNHLLENHLLDKQLDYWRNELADAPLLLGLPTNRPRPPLQTFQGKQLAFSVPAELAAKLGIIARSHNVSVFMLLLASYQLLLAQLCKQRDVCVGIPRDGRFRKELEPLAGFFINALVIRTRIDQQASLGELLAAVREKTLHAFANELVPAEQVMQALHIGRQLQFTPIVQAAFNYMAAAATPAAFNLEGLEATFIEAETGTAKFELLLTVVDDNSELHAAFEYNTGLFDLATIEHFRDGWLYLLQLLAEHPDAGVGQLHLPGHAPATEIGSLHGKPAQGDFDFMQAIAEQATHKPLATAVICGTESLSYAELETQSGQLAQHLIKLGISRGDRVAICMQRRCAWPVSILATIKTGACYVPMDSQYPRARLGYMLEDCNAAALITEQAMLEKLPATNATIIDIDATSTNTAMSFLPPPLEAGKDKLLYIIYTSGSTGKPKGVAVYHHSFANLLSWYTSEFSADTFSKTLAMSSTGFDLTQKNLFAPLITGGTLVLPGYSHFDVQALLDCIDTHTITAINCAPSAFYPLVEHGGSNAMQRLHSLQTVLFGGEPLHLQRLHPWLSNTGFNCALVNMYGPTECTDISSFHRLTPAELQSAASDPAIPLGKPVNGVSLYVLDDNLKTTPNGLTGELCISGINVGAGYWNNPELTARAFVPNPFSSNESERILYRSGDRVRLNPEDGQLYYLGRIDSQLKLRGLRIEPGEIEHCLRLLPDIKDALVTSDNGQLLAFVLGNGTLAADWRQRLCEHLPDYMLPTQVLMLNAWPLTPNGKLDRNALLALPRPECAPAAAPRNALEEQIADIWQTVLGTDRPGIFDNFFSAGGDSLAAVQLVSALETRLGLRLPVAALFGAQTIAQLAEVIDRHSAAWSAVLPLQPHGTKTPIFALHGMALSYRPLALALGNDQPFYALQPYGLEPGQTPYHNLETLLEDYVASIRQQQPHGPYQIIGHSFAGILAIELARKLQNQGEKILLVGLLDTHMPPRYGNNTIDDATLGRMIAGQFQGIENKAFIQRAIALVRGMQAMMAGFRLEALHDIPLLLFTPADRHSRLQGLALSSSQLRNRKTRGFEKVSKSLQVFTVPGDHYSMLEVKAGDDLPRYLNEAIKARADI